MNINEMPGNSHNEVMTEKEAYSFGADIEELRGYMSSKRKI